MCPQPDCTDGIRVGIGPFPDRSGTYASCVVRYDYASISFLLFHRKDNTLGRYFFLCQDCVYRVIHPSVNIKRCYRLSVASSIHFDGLGVDSTVATRSARAGVALCFFIDWNLSGHYRRLRSHIPEEILVFDETDHNVPEGANRYDNTGGG